MNPQIDMTNQARLKQLSILIALLIVVFSLYLVASAIVTASKTGLLHVSASDPKAGLVISQADTQAAYIGTGNAKVRLKPGKYSVSASNNGYQAVATVQVYKKHTTTSYLSVRAKATAALPSANNIAFDNMNALINSGISSDQINDLEQHFFSYKPSVKTVAVDASSVEPGPHNPNTDTSFTMNFNVSIDSVSYKATISYADTETVRLYLYNASGALVFDSGDA
jgi:hypothetical protein